MPDLIFFTPMLPYPTGSGSPMRASVIVELLAERYRVFVADSRIWPWRGVFDEAWVRKYATAYVTIPAQLDEQSIERVLGEEFAGANFEAAYAFRLSMAPIALRFFSVLGRQHQVTALDLDDDDVSRTERFIDLRERNGDHGLAATERAALSRLKIHQKMLMPRFDVNLLAGSGECQSLAARFPGTRFVHLPNAVREAPSLNGQPDPTRLLFLGSLDYMPNDDAVLHFCQSILPRLRAKIPQFTFRVVGGGATPRVKATGRLREVSLAGMVPDVAPEYEKAAVVVVPLRAGSGTRIKILEAFSFRRPVVSTSIGAEGLGVKHEQHLLIADTPDQFAAACARLLTDTGLRKRLVENAYSFFRTEYSLDRARCVLRSIYPA